MRSFFSYGFLLLITMLSAYYSSAQVPVNKPVAASQPAAATTVAPVPAAYPTGIKVNYVRTKEALQPVTDAATFAGTTPNATSFNVRESTAYLDGLGRPLQTVQRLGAQETGSGFRDLVTPVLYDEFGRQVYQYMPYSINSLSPGSFRMNPFHEQASYMTEQPPKGQYVGEQVFYSQTVYEPSPLNRSQKTMAPGNNYAGSGRGVSMQYLVNTVADSVRLWTVTSNALTYSNGDITTNIPATTTRYAAGELFKNVTIDERGSAVVEYKDKDGKVVLKKVQIATSVNSDFAGHMGFLSTYYVYDNLNQLRFVIPPKAIPQLLAGSWALGTDVINELCFRYEYDARGRMIAKKVPGAGWAYMVYDTRDRLLYTQDANMQASNRWLATLYDALNRPVMTGLFTYTGNRQALQDYVNGQTVGNTVSVTAAIPLTASLYVNQRQAGVTQYKAAQEVNFQAGFESESNAEFTGEISGEAPATETVITTGVPLPSGNNFIALTITYYDSYAWNAGGNKQYSTADNSKLNGVTGNRYLDAVPSDYSRQVKGMVTGTKVRILEDPAHPEAGNWLTTVSYYDEKGRAIQVQADNYNGGIDVVTTRYDFKGLPHVTYQVHNNPAAGSQVVRTRTTTKYNYLDQPASITQQLNDAGPEKPIADMDYTAYSQVQRKHVGGAFTLATQDYSYNVRGWLTGINDYTIDPTLAPWNPIDEDNRWFSMQLQYDWGFDNVQYNGNIAGIKWNSKGDGQNRAYGFGYDAANRLMSADFNQQFGSSWAKTDPGNSNFTIDFSMQMGNGTDHTTAYDENGNILAMKQWGLKATSSSVIDELAYKYNTNSNKLKNVLDGANDVNTKLGDFRSSNTYMTALGGTKTNAATDYTYDGNGNLVKDLNKDIDDAVTDGIIYNHLNLPAVIHVKNKGTITYAYDATGNKLKKVVAETGKPDKTTLYIGNMVYENDSLQFFSQPEGRVRYAKKYFTSGDSAYQYFYDYFLKDHLGNIRMVLTEQKDTAQYFASMETAYHTKEDALFANVSTTATTTASVPGGYPTDNTTSPNDYVAKVNGSNNKTGPALVLKVMSGDKLDIAVKSFYRSGGTANDNNNPVNDILASLASGIVGVAGETKGTLGQLNNTSTSPLLGAIGLFRSDNNPDQPSKPKAYLNWVLLDDQFNYVEGSSNAIPVGSADALNALGASVITMERNGFLYIYVSNETRNWDVYFDNLTVQHYTGPLTEETHYYPFGLTMAGISGKAIGRIENKYKFNGIEQNTDFDLNMYDAFYRNYNPQIGRWLQVDPKPTDVESPYAAMGNNPILYSDFLGDTIPKLVEQDLVRRGILLPEKEKNKDGDQKGIFKNAPDEMYQTDPLKAAGLDLTHFALEFFGFNSVDDFVTDRVDGKNSAGEIVAGVVNVGLATAKGEKAVVPGGDKVEIVIDGNLHPEAAKHAQDAMNSGVSGEGVIDRAGTKNRRSENLRGIETRKQKDRDEFPPAVINNGGNGSSVRHINPSDNRGAGALIGNQIRNLPDNTSVVIKVIPEIKVKNE